MNNLSLKSTDDILDPSSPWHDDKLNREGCANHLTEMLAKQQNALTVSLNGEWGSGKTFMLKRWKQQLTIKGVKAIYFNAWEDDFLTDPLIAIIGQLFTALDGDLYRNDIKNIFDTCKSMVRSSNLSINALCLRMTIDNKKVLEDSKTAEFSIFNDYINLTKSRNSLKALLKELIRKVAQGNGGMPIIFIVDELDRCRPTFAIEVLERIKHLFEL